jgi:hypothetical protein
MIRTKTLDEMVTMLRAECGESTNASMGINSVDGLYQILRRTQEQLFDEFDWGNMHEDTTQDLVPGENVYTLDDAIDSSRIQLVWANSTNAWVEMIYGISPVDYNTSNPEIDQRETTPTKWMLRPDNQFEVWPMPSVVGKIRFRHNLSLRDMTAGNSMGTLDANLIVLHAAAERLASKKDQSAPIKLKMAERRLAALRYNNTPSKVTQSYAPRSNGKYLPQNWEVRVPRTA